MAMLAPGIHAIISKVVFLQIQPPNAMIITNAPAILAILPQDVSTPPELAMIGTHAQLILALLPMDVSTHLYREIVTSV
jgi:hypothetical protein